MRASTVRKKKANYATCSDSGLAFALVQNLPGTANRWRECKGGVNAKGVENAWENYIMEL